MKIKHRLSALPAWILTGITLMTILWLTLAPKPVGDVDVPLFPGADKLVHGLMFGFLTFTGLVDWARGRGFRAVAWWEVLIAAALATGVGVAIEYIQRGMGMGRSYDVMDMVADGTGSFLVAAIWIIAEAKRRHR